VQAFLEELAERRERALVRELARAPGARETRWAHLLSGEPAEAPAPQAANDAVHAPAVGEIATLKARVDRLEQELAELRETVAKLSADHFSRRHNREGILWALLCFSTWHRVYVEPPGVPPYQPARPTRLHAGALP